MPRDPWVKVLSQLGHTRYVVELPAPAISLKSAWDPAVQQFQHALQSYREGRYEDAAGACRKVVEEVATVLSKQWHIEYLTVRGKQRKFEDWTHEINNRLRQAAGAASEEQHQADMLASLLLSAWGWTSPTHHFSGKVPQREGVRFTIFLTSSLLDMCAHVLTAHPHPLRDETDEGAE